MSRNIRIIMLVSMTVNLMVNTLPAWAQINLDEPISVGTKDQCFRSKDKSQSYCFLKQLCRVSEYEQELLNGHLLSKFDVGTCGMEVERLKKLVTSFDPSIKEVRVMRGVTGELTNHSLLPISERFTPQVKPMGDFLDLGGPVAYTLDVNYFGKKRLLKRVTPEVKDFFENPNTGYLGSIRYEFPAIYQGVPKSGATIVPIYVFGPENVKLVEIRNAMFMSPIELDSTSQCWNHLTPGKICVSN